VLAALSPAHKLGLGLSALAFVLFALIASMVVPRYREQFPGRRLGWFVFVSTLFFVGMMTAVVFFGKEEAEPGEAAVEATTTEGATTGATTTGATTTGAETSATAAGGDKVFSENCAACHTLAAAHATGNVGPNLDQLKPSEDTVEHQVENGGGGMPAFEDQLSDEQISAVAAYVSSNAGK